MGYVLTVTFDTGDEDYDRDLLSEAKDLLTDEYSGGGFSGEKPTIKIADEDD